MAKSRQMIRESALNIGALLGVICFVFAVCAVFFGITPLIFRSGSMSPAIDTGSLALARTVPASSLTVGDIVSIRIGPDTIAMVKFSAAEMQQNFAHTRL